MIPWPADPECLCPPIDRPSDAGLFGWLTFMDPAAGTRTSLPITSGPSLARGVRSPGSPPWWHAEFSTDPDGQETVTTTPSILVPGEYHSPVSVRWRIVTVLADGRGHALADEPAATT